MDYFYKESRSKKKLFLGRMLGRGGGGCGRGLEEVNFFNKESKTNLKIFFERGEVGEGGGGLE